ncbi:MAG: hypothetical protein WBE90_08160, partial [Xanthobacteraceae bacterium]
SDQHGRSDDSDEGSRPEAAPKSAAPSGKPCAKGLLRVVFHKSRPIFSATASPATPEPFTVPGKYVPITQHYNIPQAAIPNAPSASRRRFFTLE